MRQQDEIKYRYANVDKQANPNPKKKKTSRKPNLQFFYSHARNLMEKMYHEIKRLNVKVFEELLLLRKCGH